MDETICCTCGGPVIRGHHRARYGYGGPSHESPSDCVAYVRSDLSARLAKAEAELAEARSWALSLRADLGESQVKEAEHESRADGIARVLSMLAEATDYEGDDENGDDWIAHLERVGAENRRLRSDLAATRRPDYTPPPDVRSYTTDDIDIDPERHRLDLSRGDNGDWYLSVLPGADRFTRACVRITTSGTKRHGMPMAMHELWKALAKPEGPSDGD